MSQHQSWMVEFAKKIIKVEGHDYTNDPTDRGGETKYGVTKRTARRYGYKGEMEDLPYETAISIYIFIYIIDPSFDMVYEVDKAIAHELIDTGVNMGAARPSKFLQQALNNFNYNNKYGVDLIVDGDVGGITVAMLEEFKMHRGLEGMKILLSLLDGLQQAGYNDIVTGDKSQRKYFFGWLRNRTNN